MQFYLEEFEPVMCFAVRSGCQVGVLQVLQRHGADAVSCDTSGYSPLTTLANMTPLHAKNEVTGAHWVVEPARLKAMHEKERLLTMRQRLDVARFLIDSGAKPKGTDGQQRLPAALARESGNTELALFLEHYLEVQACITMLRWQPAEIADDTLRVVLAHLLPEDLLKWVSSHVYHEHTAGKEKRCFSKETRCFV